MNFVIMIKSGDNWLYLNRNDSLTDSKFKAKVWKKEQSAHNHFEKISGKFLGKKWMVSEQ